MQTFFWNLNKGITEEKQQWFDGIIEENSPSIFCLAEGPENFESCHRLVQYFEEKGYWSYYDPTFYFNKGLSDHLSWNRFGLKIFVKKGIQPIERFSIFSLKQEGRIVYLRTEVNKSYYSFFLIHGLSKSGGIQKQSEFVSDLKNFIETKMKEAENDPVVIIGDFNIEPWEEILRNDKGILSFFFEKSYNYHLSKSLKTIYFNPVFEYIQNNSNPDLIGTFYHKDYFVNILDFPLISSDLQSQDYEFVVHTEVNGYAFLKRSNYDKVYLADGFDHLPISLELK